jgi:hypothetical protein
MTDPMDILVFKTNIDREDDVMRVMSRKKEEARIRRWSVDREDCDKVLRVEADEILPDEIIEMINNAGYACEELTY